MEFGTRQLELIFIFIDDECTRWRFQAFVRNAIEFDFKIIRAAVRVVLRPKCATNTEFREFTEDLKCWNKLSR